MRIYLSGNLLRFSDYDREIDVEGETVRAGLTNLSKRYPSLYPVLFDSEDQVRAVHQIFVDGEAVPAHMLAIEANDDTDVAILTALAGG